MFSSNGSSSSSSSGSSDYDIARNFVPLCSIKPAHLDDLFSYCRFENMVRGQVVFERSNIKSEHLFLVHGSVNYVFASGHVEEVHAGDSSGPLLNEIPRPCRCVTVSDCTILVVDSERLDKALSWSQISEYVASEFSMRRDLDDDKRWFETVIDSNLFFKVPPVNVDRIFNKCIPRIVKTGEVIIKQGEQGDDCYFIKKGKASVTRLNKDNTFDRLADIGEGRCFGEDALITGSSRNATVTMTAGGQLMVLAKKDFELLLNDPDVESYSERDLNRISHPIIFIDVRTQAEYEQGHLVLSANIPLNILNLKKRILSKDKHYVFYCDTGRRSTAAAYLLAQDGYHSSVLRAGLLGAGMQYQLVTDSIHIIKNGELEKG